MSRSAPISAPLRAAAWAAALHMERFGYAEIAHAVKISHDRATSIVRGWVAAGALEEVPAEVKTRRKLWRIAPNAARPEQPRGRSPEENIWTAMRGLKSFAPSALAANATVDDVVVSTEGAKAYCSALLAAGYLRVVRKAAPPQVEAIYHLVKNTGPRPPRERRLSAVVDGNTGAVHLLGGRGQ